MHHNRIIGLFHPVLLDFSGLDFYRRLIEVIRKLSLANHSNSYNAVIRLQSCLHSEWRDTRLTNLYENRTQPSVWPHHCWLTNADFYRRPSKCYLSRWRTEANNMLLFCTCLENALSITNGALMAWQEMSNKLMHLNCADSRKTWQ